jgi:hypothetical protein
MSVEKDDDYIRPYVKRDNPFSYKSKEYYKWYYDNVLKLKKNKHPTENKEDSAQT